MMRGGQLWPKIWNPRKEAIQATPRTALVDIMGSEMSVKSLVGKETRVGNAKDMRYCVH